MTRILGCCRCLAIYSYVCTDYDEVVSILMLNVGQDGLVKYSHHTRGEKY